jgi:hypothetical protein
MKGKKNKRKESERNTNNKANKVTLRKSNDWPLISNGLNASNV